MDTFYMVCKFYLKEEGGGEEKNKETFSQEGTGGDFCSAGDVGAWSDCWLQGRFTLWKVIKPFTYALCAFLDEREHPSNKIY